MTPKEQRIVESDLNTLFSIKALQVPTTIEAWQKIDFFHPMIKTERGDLPLSAKGIAALRRTTRIIQAIPALKNLCSEREIATQVHTSYEGWLRQRLQPDAREFIDGVQETLLATVKDHVHLVILEGVELIGLEKIQLGSTTIVKADPAILAGVEFGGYLSADWIDKEFANKMWLLGTTNGSPEVSRLRFEHRTMLTVGGLVVCGSLLYKGAIWRSHVRALMTPEARSAAVSVLRWEAGGTNPILSRASGNTVKLPFEVDSIRYLHENCFLDHLTTLIDREERSELQDAIVRALYWFADAHGDQNITMRFIKLWSCAECFFAISDTDVTEANTRGMATILTFAGYKVWERSEYPQMKRRLKRLYDLRSRAVHRAEFGAVQTEDLEDFSQWIAWLIVSMAALNQRGYQTLAAVKEQAVRVDDSVNRAYST